MCPVCTVTVIAGLGISRLLGIDDIISSIWIGGVILSVSFWFVNWLSKRSFYEKIKSRKIKKLIDISVFIFMYLTALIPLVMNGSIGIPLNRLWGIDKIVIGITTGSLVFLFGIWADRKERIVRGKQLFLYQKVVFPVLTLIITSVVFMIIVNR